MTQQSMQLPPGVQVFERGWLSANNILLGGDARGAVLVDTGYCTHVGQTAALLDAALRADIAGRLRLIVNTHLHSDHCGGNARLHELYPEVPIWIPPGDFAAAAAWDEDKLSYRYTGQQCPRFTPQRALRPGELIEQAGLGWQVHAAPGHDMHAILLFEPQQRCLISADALWEHGFGIVFPEIEGEQAFDEVGDTLDLIESLDAQLVIPGHGRPFVDAPRALEEARSRLQFFRRYPERHARHAAKALIMFHLLEVRERSRQSLHDWLAASPIYERMRARFYAATPLAQWSEELLHELAASGAIKLVADQVMVSD